MKHVKMCGLLVAMLALAGPARAELMAYEFAGVVASFNDPSGVLDGSIQVGTEFSGRFTFDSDAPDLNSDPAIGEYGGPAFSMTLDIGSYSWFSGAGNGDMRVTNGDVADGMMLGTPTAFAIGEGIDIFSMGLWFSNYTGSPFTSDALPLMDPFPLSSFQRGLWVKGENVLEYTYFEFGGSITSFTVVPEPTSVLFTTLAFGLLRRR